MGLLWLISPSKRATGMDYMYASDWRYAGRYRESMKVRE